ncbi:tyrosine-type recombinase/integrase [Sphingobacterium multivorum]|uniref:tyrosine-type recombinase/integrase n=1 Tax=Sphingobacterium multivorum TaxID=28454 RepID=UPI003DA6CCC3
MNPLSENVKYRFSEPKLGKLNSSNKWFVFFYYYIGDLRKEIRYSSGFNRRYYIDYSGLGAKEIKRRTTERLNLVNECIAYFKTCIEERVFVPESKAFSVPNNEKKLVDFLNNFIKFKEKEKISSASIVQYTSKINAFKKFLESSGISDIRIGDLNKQLYIDYFQSLKDKKPKANWYNDILTLHRMFFKWLIEIEEIEIKNLVKVIKPIQKDDIVKHKAIPSSLIKESFQQIADYGSEILSVFTQFIFYSLHRPNTLTQLQFKDFDLKAGVINIPASKIKTKRAVVVKLHPRIASLIMNFKDNNMVNEDSYLFGFEYINSVRGHKKEYRLFADNQSETMDYIQKFKHFNEKQIAKAYKKDDSLIQIFKYGENTLYGYKHTGVVYLREKKWSLEQIIQLTGHKDTEIAKWYGRDYKPLLPEFVDL